MFCGDSWTHRCTTGDSTKWLATIKLFESSRDSLHIAVGTVSVEIAFIRLQCKQRKGCEVHFSTSSEGLLENNKEPTRSTCKLLRRDLSAPDGPMQIHFLMNCLINIPPIIYLRDIYACLISITIIMKKSVDTGKWRK